MSQSDIYTILCVVEKGDVSFPVEIDKNKIIGLLKKEIIKEKPSYANIDPNFLDLYLVDIPDAQKAELKASVGAQVLDLPQLPSRSLTTIFPTGPKPETVHFIVKTSRKRPASTELSNPQAKRKQLIKNLKIVTPSSATLQTVQSALKDAVDYNRPEAKRETIPIVLLHEVFGVFSDNCQEYVPTHKDNQLLVRLSAAMSKEYKSDAERTSTFREILRNHGGVPFMCSKVKGSAHETDGDISMNGHIIALSVGKCEWVNLKADPVLQAFVYWIQSLKSGPFTGLLTRLPCLIIYYAGPLIGFAGATFADKPMIEPLTPMFAFNTNANDSNASRPLSRALGAMIHAIKSLEQYYAQVDAAVESDSGNAILHQQLEYPYRNHYTAAGNKVEFQYDRRLDQGKLLFLCTRTDDETNLYVKFTQKYSTDAHKYCADKGVAPKLYAVEKLPGGWLMVVMEYLDSYTALVDLPNKMTMSCETAATAAVGILHDGGFVHGDIRDANMMAENGTDENSQRSVKLVDFDWAGKDGETIYPPNVNYTQIRRPMDAKDGMPIKMSHDDEMLSYIFSPASTQGRPSSS